ncbi:MAG: S49 family peptidase [Candidatus Kerfeldbacteria bacterium]|nr:S49 family peptidase [Candidatus Kerfeldbacteria bacterium]
MASNRLARWFKLVLKTIAIFIVTLTVVSYWYDFETSNSGNERGCNVAGIELHGTMVTYNPKGEDSESTSIIDQTASEDILTVLENVTDDDTYKGILLEIDSYGGAPVAGEEIADALKKMEKPTVALIREGGVSAAYLAASGADYIVASRNSDVGGIGVTQSYVDNVQKNQRDGLTYNELRSATFKDAGDPDKPLTDDERKLFERDLTVIHDNFVQAVSDNRKIDLGTVRRLADGSSMLGAMAMENKLIDKLGSLDEAKNYLYAQIGEVPKVCW